nr:MAG TPA: hypothetical protein [Caudoviricetes sp.]
MQLKLREIRQIIFLLTVVYFYSSQRKIRLCIP